MSSDPPASFSTTPFPLATECAEPTEKCASGANAERFTFGDVPRLTAALRRGDEAAYAWLHGEWSVRLNRYCFALAAGDAAFAREVAQAAWLRLVRHVRPMRDAQALWNWMACAARHAATDLRRTGGRYLSMLRRFAEGWPRRSDHSYADDGLLAALEAALQRLDSGERALIESRYFENESLETIGKRHALSVRSVEGRLARLRVRLRGLIAAELKSPNL